MNKSYIRYLLLFSISIIFALAAPIFSSAATGEAQTQRNHNQQLIEVSISNDAAKEIFETLFAEVEAYPGSIVKKGNNIICSASANGIAKQPTTVYLCTFKLNGFGTVLNSIK
jgi:hypothetical protein